MYIDSALYLPSWEGVSNMSIYDSTRLDNFESAFVHQAMSEVNGSLYWGLLYMYDGGGYIANLGESFEETEAMLNYLQDNNWIDSLTRVVFVEFNILNGNTNLFNLVKIAFETPPSGGVFKWYTIESVQLYRYVGALGLLSLLVEIVLALFVTGLLIKEIITMCKQGKAYFHGCVTIVLLVIIVSFYAALGCYVYRSILTVSTVENLRNNVG